MKETVLGAQLSLVTLLDTRRRAGPGNTCYALHFIHPGPEGAGKQGEKGSLRESGLNILGNDRLVRCKWWPKWVIDRREGHLVLMIK